MAWRNKLTAVSSPADGRAGARSHSASISASRDTTAPRADAKMASSRRSRAPPRTVPSQGVVASLQSNRPQDPDPHGQPA